MKEIKLFSTQIATWGLPLLIWAFDENDAEELTRVSFKIASDVGITARLLNAKEGEKEGLYEG